jgi:hypothetical protein
MSKGDRENMGTETEGCVLDLHLSDETHFVLRCLTVVGKSAANKCQSKNGTPATPFLCEHSREYAFWPNYSSNPLEVILMLPPLGIYIAGEARQATWLNCSREFTRPRFGGFCKDDWWVAISSGSRGQIFSWISIKKLLAKPRNVGNFASERLNFFWIP